MCHETYSKDLFGLLLGRAGRHRRAWVLHRRRSLHRRHDGGLCVLRSPMYTPMSDRVNLGLCTGHVDVVKAAVGPLRGAGALSGRVAVAIRCLKIERRVKLLTVEGRCGGAKSVGARNVGSVGTEADTSWERVKRP